MKYMLLIHQGDTPDSRTPEWEALSEDEQKRVLRRLPGDQPDAGRDAGRVDGAAGAGDDGPRRGRQDADDRRARSSP